MEREYTNKVGLDHRKQLGQFFTPPAVSRFMIDWVSDAERIEIFDPAFGLGAFYQAMPPEKRSGFQAMEIDPKVIQYWAKSTNASTAFIQQSDYLKSWGKTHRNIICNPPYMRFQKFANRDTVFRDFESKIGLRLSGYTNTASAFLLKSLEELEPGGRLAYIMPLEFLNAGYGQLVKECILKDCHLSAVISFENEKEIFPEATTSVGIILLDASRAHENVSFYSVDSLASLEKFTELMPVSMVSSNQLNPTEKWLPYFSRQSFSVSSELSTPLSTYGRFSRGIATGANEFFTLSPSRIAELGLDADRDCSLCITKSAQIKGAFFNNENLEALKSANKAVFLFSAEEPLSLSAKEYVRLGEEAGYNQRYLTKNRKPWFKAETRQAAPLLLGVFSRGGYKIIRNYSDALNLTCYHGFQPDLFGHTYINQLFLYFCSDVGRQVTSLCARKYGDALDKFEPNDINAAKVPTPSFFDELFGDRLEEAMEIYRTTGVIPQWLEDALRPIQIEQRTDLRTVA